MSKIIACIDGSDHLDSICDLASWINKNTKLEISLLHVAVPHDGVAAKGNLSGSIGLGAQGGLLEKLSEDDEAHGKMEQKKGQEILDHANEKLAQDGIKNVENIHRRGSLVEIIVELEGAAELIVLGKSGESTSNLDKIGSNLEDVIRKTSKPLLVATKKPKEIRSFLIAYDGSDAANKALDYIISNSLLKKLDCHLLKVNQSSGNADGFLKNAENKLKEAGFKVSSSLKEGKSIEGIVLNYIDENDIGLLVIGAYGHSKIHNFILGSTTNALLSKAQVPVLLFK